MRHRAVVSVVIPCYRQARLLSQAIDSALVQTYSHREVIVVNDGSDDHTDEVVASYGDDVRYIVKENGGLSSARNAGLQVARGDYVYFLDADDLVHPEGLQWLVAAMEGRNDHLAIMGYRSFSEVPDECGQREFIPSRRCPLPRLIHSNFGAVHSVLCSREAVMQVGGFDEALRSCEDWDLWLRMVFHGAQVATVARIGAYYRRYAGSMSTDSQAMLASRTMVLLKTHRAIVGNAELLSQYGHDLLDAELRVLRRWLAQRCRDESGQMERLIAAIRELSRNGIRTTRSRTRRFLDRVLGRHSEALAVAFFKYFRPRKFATYFDGCN